MGYYNKKTNEEDLVKLTYTITIDPTSQLVKPSKNDGSLGKISNNLRLVTGVTLNDFQRLSERPLSYTWFGGTLDGAPKNENWLQQSVFAIDFDQNKISIKDAVNRLKSVYIHPQLWYTTLSSTEEHLKFRIVLFVDTPITNINYRDNIINGLLKLFPESDQTCKNAGRFFFGGIESRVIHYEPIPTEILHDNLCIELISKDGGRTRCVKSPNIDETCQLGEKRDVQYSIYRNDHISPSNICSKNYIHPTYVVGENVIDINKARANVKILDEFLNGTWLYHTQLFGLATNLNYIKGGKKLMKETMEKYNKMGLTKYTENNFNIIKYINKVNYYPQSIKSFSPYEEDEELHDLISATKNIRGHIEVIEPIIKMPLVEAEMLFKERFNEALSDNTNSIYLFVLPTAIGKTEALTSINATIAAPTNELKNEISSRMKVDYIITPDMVCFENESLNRKIDYYYRIGKPKKVIALLYDIRENKDSNNSINDQQIASNYLSQLICTKNSTQTVLTTHSRAIHSSFNNSTIVFDEDPISSLIDIKQMDLTDLRKISYELGNNSEFNCVLELLESSTRGVIYSTPTQSIDIEAMIENISLSNIESNIFDFFSSDYFIRDTYEPHIINYVVKRKLPEDKKIIILSATLSLFVYKKLFGERLKIIDIRDVEQVGSVIQYTKRSCSRNNLKSYVKDISILVGDKPVITFKSYGGQFKNAIKEMYFGNCSGYDSMKGKDLVVVGTPHRNQVQYLLMAKTLGIDLKTSDITITYQKVTYNGFRFMFNCFDHEDLREIQLSLIESDLIQAIGRARTLREKATVEVFSNFPLRLADGFII